MNEQIRELAEQAVQYALDKANQGDEESEYTFDDDFNEKFAELIIRECTNLMPTIWSANPLIVSARFKERFGVEE